MIAEINFFGIVFSFASLSLYTGALVLLAGICTVFAYTSYFSHVKNEISEEKPNPFSWGIWGVTTLVEALTYNLVSQDALQSGVFFISAFACLVVSWAVIRYGKLRWPDLTEWLCILATIGAIVVWVVFHEEWWAHLIMVFAVPVSFIPIWVETWHQPEKERATPWVWWSIGDLLAFILVLSLFQGNQKELPYVIVEFACHFGMLLIIIGRKSNKKKKLRESFAGPLAWKAADE